MVSNKEFAWLAVVCICYPNQFLVFKSKFTANCSSAQDMLKKQVEIVYPTCFCFAAELFIFWQVGYKAVDDYVRSDMVVGLGTGSTAYFAVERGI